MLPQKLRQMGGSIVAHPHGQRIGRNNLPAGPQRSDRFHGDCHRRYLLRRQPNPKRHNGEEDSADSSGDGNRFPCHSN